ncbi:MAG: FAD-dependent oxidoreductase [Anaerolineae bacterium]|nr:FAD-dependent oxidoreductase [Anaerolineae bacterium]
MTKMITEPERTIPVLGEVDVLVAGAGVAGVAAAVAAARVGAKTMLVERMGFLGGVAAAALMTSTTNFMFTGDGRQVVKGIAEEVLDKLAERGATSPDWRTRALPQFPFDQEAFRVVLIEMIQDAGVETLVETWISDVIKEGNVLKGVVIESKSGRQAILSKVCVDATGDADLAARAGAPCRDTPPDSGSLLFQMRNVDLDKTVAYFEEHPEEWQQYCDRVTPLEDFIANWRERGIFHLPHGGGRNMRLVQDAIARGEYIREKGLCKDLDVFGMFAYRESGAVLINSCNFRIDHLDIRTHSQAELEARRLVPLTAEFLRTHMPGFENAIVSETAPMVGVRYTRWIDAGFDLTAQHVSEGARFDDVIGVETAFADHPKGGVLHPPRTHDIPYRIMLPQNVENLIVASGKSVSTNPRGLIRGQVSCYVLGQAGGVAAAVAARNGTTARDVNIREVQRELLRQNVCLGEPDRLAQLGLA